MRNSKISTFGGRRSYKEMVGTKISDDKVRIEKLENAKDRNPYSEVQPKNKKSTSASNSHYRELVISIVAIVIIGCVIIYFLWWWSVSNFVPY